MNSFLSRAVYLGVALGCFASLAVAGDAPNSPLSSGQKIYVPVYSHILHGNINNKGNPSTLLLSSMLSVRNTDPYSRMKLTVVKYYDTEGALLRDYLKEPVILGPMGSTEFFVEHSERKGGAGANFVLAWEADKAINPPIAETVNAYFFGTHSMAFATRGEVIHSVK
ncbi:MAG: DUF3124 domain-containing protein [Magnetococcales bacterium]|nr:DUF3124 domain-containing protein [Magnetococcales bacterium]